MVGLYAHGECGLGTVRRFYELYPQGLREKDGTDCMPRYPLSATLGGLEEPDADFFIWMAEQYPETVYDEPIPEYAVLHEVCSAMAAKENDEEYIPIMCTPNMAKICRFLISEQAGLIHRQVRGDGPLPIHELANCCNRSLVQELAVLLMKAYTECVRVKGHKWDPDLPTVPFIPQVHPLILDEWEIDQEILLLAQISQNMAKAATLSENFNSTYGPTSSSLNSSLIDCVSEVLCSWANLQVSDDLPARKSQIQERITYTCRLLEGDDVPDEVWEEEEDDDDDHDGGGGDDHWNGGCASEFENEEGDVPDEIDKEDDGDGDSESDFEN